MGRTNEEWQRLSTLFDELVELPEAVQKQRLATLAAQEPQLVRQLEAMLLADAQASGVLDRGVEAVAPTVVGDLARGSEDSTPEPAPPCIGRFRLIRLLGRGGMGEVYLAESTKNDFVQQVALKLLKRGMDSDDILRRFAQERRILAQLNHPNIARLVDGGISEQGRPYYAMEYVDGLALTEFARERGLDVRGRVRLMISICAAVAHAQTRLVVHRDLKPSNILVDASGQPRVLDFGIAKILSDTEDDRMTLTGARALSPAYAAPEQISGEPVSTATDVYALGVVLYELLSGQLPNARSIPARTSELSSDSVERPSQSLRSIRNADITQTYGERSGERERHARTITGDLDTIVLTALRREPERRYANASALGDDLGRWLDGRTINARADSAAYRTFKFVHRHRVAVAAAMLITLSLLVGLGVALWQTERAQAAAQLAEHERARATQQAQRAERVKDYVLSLFREQDPLARAQARQRSAGELIAEGLLRADALAADPILHAEVRSDLAEVQFGLGDFKSARSVFESVLAQRRELFGAESAEVGQVLADLGGTLLALGEAKLAEPMLRDAVRLLRATRGVDDTETLQAEGSLAKLELAVGKPTDALPLAQHVVDVYKTRLGAEHAEMGPRLSNLGAVLERLDKLAEAEQVLRQSLLITERELGPEHVATVYPRTRLADILRRQRNYPEAEAVYRKALGVATAQLPANHVTLGQVGMRLGDLQRRQRKYVEAEATLAAAEIVLLAVNAPEYGQVQQYRGRIAQEQGDFAGAVRHYRAGYAHFEKVAADSIFTWGVACMLAVALAENGEVVAGERLAREALAAMERLAEPKSYDRAMAYSALGEVMRHAGKHAQAVDVLRKALHVNLDIYGEAHAGVAEARLELAAALIATDEPAARREVSELLDKATSILEQDASTQLRVGELLLARARLALAEDKGEAGRTLLDQAAARLQRDRGESHPRTREALALAQSLGRVRH